MREKTPFALRRRVAVSLAVLLIPLTVVFVLMTQTAMRQIENQVGMSNVSSLRLYMNTLQGDIERAERVLTDIAYSDSTAGIGGSLNVDSLETLRWTGEELFRDDVNVTAVALSQPATGESRLEFNPSMISGGDTEDKIYELVNSEIVRMELPLGWFTVKQEDRHYLCRTVERDGFYITAIYDFGQVAKNAPIFYGQKDELVFFNKRDILANREFTELTGIDLDYDNENSFYFSGPGRDFLIAQEQLINFKVALINPYYDMNSSMRLLYLSPVLYGAIIFLCLCVVLAVLNRSLFRPLKSLVHVMERLQGGDLTARLEGQRSREFVQVQKTFNTMVTELSTARIRSYEQQLEIQREQLNALRMQIRPHFYLNCLKGIYGLAQMGRTEKIQRAIIALSKHLRYVMDIDTDTIKLEKELQMCENYIDLQRYCDCGDPELKMSIDGPSLDVPVPPVTILTLVENSVKHGTRGDGDLKVTIRVKSLEADEERSLDITVCDNGPGFAPQQLEKLNGEAISESGGVGLANTIKRFKLLYGDRCMIRFYNNNGAVVEIAVLLREPR